jgi:UDP-N-acetyl-D-mannosaminuronate dehydrogenase
MVFYDHAAPSESSSTGTPLSEYAWSSSEGYASTASLSPTTPNAEPADSYFRPVVRSDEPPIVAVMGVGYVGLHLVTEFATRYKVVAYDVNAKRLAQLTEEYKSRSNIYFTNDASKLQAATHFLVAVPTPLFPGTTETDTRIIRSALGTICENVRPGATVVIESSVSVGMTRALLGDMVRTYGLKAGMSPEVSP